MHSIHKMKESRAVNLFPISQFHDYPIFVQILCVAVGWIFVTFTVDCWFTPFVIKGYLLASYLVVLIVLSAWLTQQSLCHVTQSKILWKASNIRLLNIPSLHGAGKLSVKDISERELNLRARKSTQEVIKWYSEFSDNEEFSREVQNQVEDILSLLMVKLSQVEIESFLRSVILIFHNHLKSYLAAVKTAEKLGSTPVEECFRYAHPVSRGELSLESYLDSLSRGILGEYIPGSVQDCRAVYSLICAAFSSRILLNFVKKISNSERILESIIRMLDSLPSAENNREISEVDFCRQFNRKVTSSPVDDFPGSPDISDGLDLDINFDASDEEDKECVSLPDDEDSWDGEGKSSPILAGNLAVHPASDSCIKTGLSMTVSTLTAPIVPQCSELHSCEDSLTDLSPDVPNDQLTPCKPTSLPVIVNDGEALDGSKSSMSVEDVSPVYEDVEDFATAIAKLRSLLEQRESNGGEVSGAKGNISTSPADLRTSLNSGGETESSFEELTEASEIPVDSRIFLNIKIPRTEVMNHNNEGQHSVYCIVYDGIYNAVSTPNGPSGETAKSESRLVLKSRTVRRRFRQFLQLHAQLEASDSAVIRQAMRPIRGPSKWLNLPFSRLDQNTVAHRRMFLERYMQQLCSSVQIATCMELRLFLEYEMNVNETAAASTTPSQRVPFLAKTVSDVLHSIKTALPLPLSAFDSTDQASPVQLVPLPPPTPSTQLESVSERDFFNFKSSPSVTSMDEVDGDVKFTIALSTEVGSLEHALSTYVHHIDCRVESAYEAFESHLWRSELNVLTPESPNADVHDKAFNGHPKWKETDVIYPVVEEGWNRFDDILPLSSSLVNLLVGCLSCRETWLGRAPVPLVVKILFGEWMENLIQTQIRRLADPEKLTDGVKLLRQKLMERASERDSVTAPSPRDINSLRNQVVHLLLNRLPGLASLLLGKDLCRDVLSTVVGCLTHEKLNRDLSLTFLDFFSSQISSLSRS